MTARRFHPAVRRRLAREAAELLGPPLAGSTGPSGPPVRMRLSRVIGFDLQAASRALNGRPAASIARPGIHGNRFRFERGDLLAQLRAVQDFEQWFHSSDLEAAIARRAAEEELTAHNLACWCAMGAPCHGDVILAYLDSRQRSKPPLICEEGIFL